MTFDLVLTTFTLIYILHFGPLGRGRHCRQKNWWVDDFADSPRSGRHHFFDPIARANIIWVELIFFAADAKIK